MKVQGGGGSQRMGTSLDAKAVLERQRWLKLESHMCKYKQRLSRISIDISIDSAMLIRRDTWAWFAAG